MTGPPCPSTAASSPALGRLGSVQAPRAALLGALSCSTGAPGAGRTSPARRRREESAASLLVCTQAMCWSVSQARAPLPGVWTRGGRSPRLAAAAGCRSARWMLRPPPARAIAVPASRPTPPARCAGDQSYSQMPRRATRKSRDLSPAPALSIACRRRQPKPPASKAPGSRSDSRGQFRPRRVFSAQGLSCVLLAPPQVSVAKRRARLSVAGGQVRGLGTACQASSIARRCAPHNPVNARQSSGRASALSR